MASNRREFLAAGSAFAAFAVAPKAFAQWQPSQRIPDPAWQILDPGFGRYRIAQSKVERLATGMRMCASAGRCATGCS